MSPFAKAKCSRALVLSARRHHAHRACELTARSMQKTASSELLSVTQTLRLHFFSSAQLIQTRPPHVLQQSASFVNMKFWTTTTRFFALAVLPWCRSITQTRSALRHGLAFTRSVISARGATTRVEKHRCHAHCEIRRRGAHFSFGGHRDRYQIYLSWPGHSPYSRRRAAIKAARARGAATGPHPSPLR